MALESTITANVIKYLNSLPRCRAEKIAGNAFQKDKPDINGCWEGKMFKIEMKSPDHGNKPTPGQLLELKKWAKVGAICFVAWSVDEVRNIFEHYGCFNSSFTGWWFNSEGKLIKGGH